MQRIVPLAVNVGAFKPPESVTKSEIKTLEPLSVVKVSAVLAITAIKQTAHQVRFTKLPAAL